MIVETASVDSWMPRDIATGCQFVSWLRPWRALALAGWAFLPLWLGPFAVFAQFTDSQTAVEAGRRALANRGSYPWYDAERDAVRRIDVRAPQPTAAHRGSTWESQPPPPTTWSPFWRQLWQVLSWIFWGLIVLLLAALIVLLVRAFLKREAQADELPSEINHEPRTAADLIENLPFQVPRPRADLLAEARRLYAAGRFDEAVIYLFSYQLVQLDQHQLIRLARGKTNRQYLREIWPRPDLRDLITRTMLAFEDVFFGRHPLERARFEACWSGLDDFHQRLEGGTTT